jgi:hypothetical protein
VKPGDYFKRKPDANPVYIKGDYDRATKTFECNKTDDIWGNGSNFKATTLVYIRFTY